MQKICEFTLFERSEIFNRLMKKNIFGKSH